MAIRHIDLRECYIQPTPNRSIDHILMRKDGVIDKRMTNAPHTEIARIYYRHGANGLRNKFRKTRYRKMFKHFGRRKAVGRRMIGFFESMRHGYRRSKKYKQQYIVVLEEPFANTRYERNIPVLVPEVWSGHHRIGALIALKRYHVDVVIAKDLIPGSKSCYGKIHDLCVSGN